VASASIDSPRFDHDPTTLAPRGLLIEGQASTLNQWSEDFTNAYWQKINSTIDTSASVSCPDNVARTTVRVVDNASNASHSIRRGIATTAGTTYTLSLFVRKGSTDTFAVQCYWNASYNYTLLVSSIDNNTQTITSASGVNATATRVEYSAFGSSPWYRYSITFTHPSAVGAATPDFNFCPINNISAYVGSGNHTDFFGIQLESGSFASSYIPTGASTATRDPDNCVMTGTDFSSWYNQTEGTFACNYDASASAGLRIVGGVNFNNAATAYIDVVRHQEPTYPTRAVVLDTTIQSSLTDSGIGSSLSRKAAHAYMAGDAALVVNARAPITSAPGTIPTVDRLQIGALTTGTGFLNGTISSIKYWPTRLPDATLQSLTT
jgi:hypothetical protein